MRSSISVIIPIYNSRSSLEELYQRLTVVLEGAFRDHEIIMIDDGSRDSSYQKICDLRERDRRIKAIKLADNFGQQNTLMCGFQYATGEYVATLDDDLQYLPEDINKLVNTLEKGYDVVYGIPEERQDIFYRRWGSRLTDLLFNVIADKDPGTRVSSFRVMRKPFLAKIKRHKSSFVYISAIILKYTDNIGNVTVSCDKQKYRGSNYTFLKLVKLFIKLSIYYSELPGVKIFRSKGPQFIIEEQQGIKENPG